MERNRGGAWASGVQRVRRHVEREVSRAGSGQRGDATCADMARKRSRGGSTPARIDGNGGAPNNTVSTRIWRLPQPAPSRCARQRAARSSRTPPARLRAPFPRTTPSATYPAARRHQYIVLPLPHSLLAFKSPSPELYTSRPPHFLAPLSYDLAFQLLPILCLASPSLLRSVLCPHSDPCIPNSSYIHRTIQQWLQLQRECPKSLDPVHLGSNRSTSTAMWPRPSRGTSPTNASPPSQRSSASSLSIASDPTSPSASTTSSGT